MPDQELDPIAIQPGTSIGPYRVLGRIGQGGMGAVYKVERDGLPFALKLSTQKHSDLTSEERAQLEGRIRREVSALTGLHHPNVVRIHAFDRYPDVVRGYLYLVMDYVEGERPYVWQENHRPPLRRLAGVFLRLARALQELHAHGVHHRDIKSSNVIVRSDGEPILIDFGIARAASACTLTKAGCIIGTSTHLSPEYARHVTRGEEERDERYTFRPTDDLHAVGVMLYEMLAGRPPFALKEGDEWTLLNDIARRVPASPRALNPLVPEALDAIAMKLLAKEPAARFQSGDELAQALEAALGSANASWEAPFECQAPRDPEPVRTQNARGSQQQAPADAAGGIAELLLPRLAAASRAPEAVPAPAVAAPAPAVARQGFAPPTVAVKSFQAPEPDVAVPTSASEARGAGLPTAIRVASQLSRNAPPRRGHVLVGAGALAGVALIGLALATAPREERPHPRSLLQEHLQAEQAGTLPAPVGFPAAPAASTLTAPPASAEAGARPPLPVQVEVREPARHARPPARPASSRKAPSDDAPAWLKGAVADAPRSTAPAAGAGPARLGVPFGAHIRARLRSNLDSRTVGEGLVEAVLVRPHVERGEQVLPSRTMLYGRAQLSGERFIVQLTRLTLPDGTEVPVKASVLDLDGKPGLAAGRRIRAEEPAKQSVPEVIARTAAGALLGQVGGNPAADAAGAAGRQVLDAKSASAGRAAEAALLDAGADFEVVVQEAF
ncbi:MAG TPA: protein kinase [Myxococcaceae bacterium]|jgi:serine/threonine-protein kinase